MGYPIHIKAKNKGKFTKKMTGSKNGHLTDADIRKGEHSKNKKTREEANFAKMARRDFKPLGDHFCHHHDTEPQHVKGKNARGLHGRERP